MRNFQPPKFKAPIVVVQPPKPINTTASTTSATTTTTTTTATRKLNLLPDSALQDIKVNTSNHTYNSTSMSNKSMTPHTTVNVASLLDDGDDYLFAQLALPSTPTPSHSTAAGTTTVVNSVSTTAPLNLIHDSINDKHNNNNNNNNNYDSSYSATTTTTTSSSYNNNNNNHNNYNMNNNNNITNNIVNNHHNNVSNNSNIVSNNNKPGVGDHRSNSDFSSMSIELLQSVNYVLLFSFVVIIIVVVV